MSVASAIVARRLVKRFGRRTALDELDLEVLAGEVHGFLGPNGSGKTTTLRALLGLIGLDEGSARVLGQDPWRDGPELHRRIAYVPGDVALWPNLSGGETIDLLLRLRGVGPGAAQRSHLLERFELDPTTKGRAYSKGNRQKVALVAALCADVELLILDEPTSGLDPLMERVFAECVRERVVGGSTVLLSSHILSEVERLADRVTIIRDGRTVESGSIGDLRHLRRTHVEATTDREVHGLDALPGVHDVSWSDRRVSLTVEPSALPEVLGVLTEAGITSLTCAPPTLEDLFLDAYRAPREPTRTPVT